MDFGALPPEFTSALLYTGPGSGPMVAAASAWNGVAAELNSTALAYEAQITQLTSEEWLGPASASMAEVMAWDPALTRAAMRRCTLAEEVRRIVTGGCEAA